MEPIDGVRGDTGARIGKGPFSRGFLIPVAVFILFGICLLTSSLFMVSRNYQGQVQHLNRQQVVFHIAFSVYSKILVRLREKSWQERFFKGSPAVEKNQSLFDGTYDSFVIDAPNREYQADIYIKASAFGQKGTYFWRVLYQDDLLDISNRVYTIFFSDIDPSLYPNGVESSFAPDLERILTERKANRPKAQAESSRIVSLPGVNEIAGVLSATPAGSPPLPDPPIGSVQGGEAPTPPGVFTSPGEREAVAPPVPGPRPADLITVQGPVDIRTAGSAARVAAQDGTVTFVPYPIVPSGTSVALVRLIGVDGKETLFNGFPLFLWNRQDGFGNFPSVFKGVEDPTSMEPQAAGDFQPRAGLSYSFAVAKGERVTFELTGIDDRGFLQGQGVPFE